MVILQLNRNILVNCNIDECNPLPGKEPHIIKISGYLTARHAMEGHFLQNGKYPLCHECDCEDGFVTSKDTEPLLLTPNEIFHGKYTA